MLLTPLMLSHIVCPACTPCLVLSCRRETLRVHNVVPELVREAAQDIELEGYAVSQGTTLYLPLHTVIANDPRWLQDEPDVFRPERMLTPQGKKPGDQMSFGYGPR